MTIIFNKRLKFISNKLFQILFAFFIFVTFTIKAKAQSKLMDSLRQILLTSSDTKIKIDALNSIAFNYRNKNADSTRILSMQALNWSRKENYHIGMGVSYTNFGYTYYLINNDSALYYFKKAQSEYVIEPPNLLRASRAFNGIANTYIQKTQFDSAIHYATLSYKYTIESKDTGKIKTERLMYAFGTLANTYYAASNYEKSNENFIQATKIGEALNNYEMLVVYYNGIANIQGTFGEFKKALYYGEKSANASFMCKDYSSWVLALANQSAYYAKLKNFSMADKFADSSLKMGNKYNVKRYEGRNYLTLGQIKMEENKYEAALQLFKTGLASNQLNKGSEYSKFVLLKETANAYKELDSLKLATDFYLQSIHNSEGDPDHQSACYYGLSKTYYKLADYKNAYMYYEKYKLINDSIFAVEKTNNINQLNIKFETEKKDFQLLSFSRDKQLSELELKRKQQEIINAGLIEKTLHQQIVTANLFAFKQDQQIELQTLGLEKNNLQIQKQQLSIQYNSDQLKIESQQKQIHLATIKDQKKNFLILLLTSLITVLFGVFFIYRYKVSKKREREKAILSERTRLGQDLHDELGATLSGISMYSHLTKEQMKHAQTAEVEKSLNIMQHSASEMVNKLNDIVWLINPGQDTLQKLVHRLEEYAGEMAAIKDMKVKIIVPEIFSEQSLPVESRRNIYLFCKEVINNAVKYSEASLLELTVKENNKILEISISDNGKGFDAEKVKRGNGLDNMQKRATELGADFNLQSKPDEGCLISLKVKITQ